MIKQTSLIKIEHPDRKYSTMRKSLNKVMNMQPYLLVPLAQGIQILWLLDCLKKQLSMLTDP